MNFQDTLSIIAEFSIGLAGFSGIIAAVTKTTNRYHRVRLENLLATSFIPGFCAFITLFLLHLGFSENSASRFVSALLTISIVTLFIHTIQERRKFKESELEEINSLQFWFNVITLSGNISISRERVSEKFKVALLQDLQKYAELTSHKMRAPLARMQGVMGLISLRKDELQLPALLSLLEDSSTELDEITKEMNHILTRNAYDGLDPV